MEKWVTSKNTEYYDGLPDGEEWTDYVTDYKPGCYINVSNFGEYVIWCMSGTDEQGNYFETEDYQAKDLETAIEEAYEYNRVYNEPDPQDEIDTSKF